jgi:hypothetical protein
MEVSWCGGGSCGNSVQQSSEARWPLRHRVQRDEIAEPVDATSSHPVGICIADIFSCYVSMHLLIRRRR